MREIVEAGITSGCKKVLKAVLAARNVGAKGKIKKISQVQRKRPCRRSDEQGALLEL